MGQHRCEHSTGRAALERAHGAQDDRGEAEHRVSGGGAGGDHVEHGGDQHRPVLGQRGEQRSAEEQLFGHSVDDRDEDDQPQRADVGVLQHPGDVVGHRGDLPAHQPADDEHRPQRQPDPGAGEQGTLVAAAEVDVPEVQWTRDERAEGPHPGQGQREPDERRILGWTAQRITQQRAADQQHDADHDLAPPDHRGRLVVLGRLRAGDVVQLAGQSGAVVLGHANPTFGTSPSTVSTPVRTAAATGPGISSINPRTGCTTDGVTAQARRRSRNASPPAQSGSVSAR